MKNTWKHEILIQTSAEKPEYKRPLVKPNHRRQDNIKVDFRGPGYDDVD